MPGATDRADAATDMNRPFASAIHAYNGIASNVSNRWLSQTTMRSA